MSRILSRKRACFLLGAVFGILINRFILRSSVKVSHKPLKDEIENLRFESLTLTDEDHYESKLADELYDKVKVLCWVMICPKYHKTRGIHIKNTWGRKCNKLLFMSSEHDSEIGSIALPNMKEKKNHLWSKTKKSFELINKEYLKEYDWILKADDDTYMVMENVRELLSQYNPETSLYFGHRMISNRSIDGFMQGGAYILSRKAVQKFVKTNKNCRKKDGWAEDLYMGQCLTNKSIFVDTRDENKEARFMMFGVERHFEVYDPTNWFYDMAYYDIPHNSLTCCSAKPAGFHYIKRTSEIFALHYFTYHVHPFGIYKNSNEKLPRKFTLKEVLEASDVASNSTNYRKHKVVHDMESSELF